MIQCPATGTLDLEFGVLTHTGKKSFALSASAIFHLDKPLISARLHGALSRARDPGWLAGSACDLQASGGVTAHNLKSPFIFRCNAKAPINVGALWFLVGIKKPA